MNENTPIQETPEPQPWQMLDEVVRKWVSMSGFQKDQDRYAILKEMYD
jgi:hypothetical protein